ncbi:MAG: CBS domain-containing protein [Candidatus Omnitrophota bacterium]|nr:CBS domain-containing protein [Candidatus Omnitrophota bacterium]
MKIKEWITREIVTIKPEASVKEAFMLLKSMGIRHLPVVKNGVLKGIVTDRDLRRPKLSDVFKSWDQLYRINDEIQVEDIMASPALTISEEATIQEAAKIMAKNRIGALPVTDKKGKLDGIITESDILRAFAAGKK